VAQLGIRNFRHRFDTVGTPGLRAVRELQTPPAANEPGLRACTDAGWKLFESATLQDSYAVVIVNQLRIKIRDASTVRTLSLNLALGVRFDGTKEILALEPTLAFVDGLHERGVEAVFLTVLETNDDLCGAFAARFPKSHIVACIVQLVRQSLACVTLTDRPSVAAALKGIYREPNIVSALSRLESFALGKWGGRYPRITELWRQQWKNIAGHFELPTALRQFLETVDAVGAFQEKLQRQAVSFPTSFKSEEVAADMLLSLTRNCASGWKVAPRQWMCLTARCAALREHPIRLD
jgi:transposase-like protein